MIEHSSHRPSATPRDSRSTPMFGRDRELATLQRTFDAARHGTAAAVLVRGAPGSGRTSILNAAGELGEFSGTAVISVDSTAPVESQLAPFAPAVAANAYSSAVVAAGALRRSLASVRHPLVVCVDDVHDHSAVTRHLVRFAASVRSPSPIVWLVSSSAMAVDAVPEQWPGFETIDLMPLERDDVAEFAAWGLGGQPDARVVDYLTGGSRLPLQLHHDIDAVRTTAAHADPSEHWPHSVVAATATATCQILAPAALLGPQFSARELAQLLEAPVGSLIRPLRSAMHDDVIVEAGDALKFSHRLVREAFSAALSGSDLLTLAPRAIQLLADRSTPAAALTDTALAIARRLGTAAIGHLESAIATVKPHDVALAARLETRLLELLDASDPRSEPTTAAVIAHFGQAGQLDAARTLAEKRASAGGAELWLARSQLEFPFSFLDARSAANVGLTISSPGTATHARLLAMEILAGQLGEADLDADTVLALAQNAATKSRDAGAEALAQVNSGLVHFVRFQWNEALRDASAASDQKLESLDHSEWWYAALLRAEMLRVRARHVEAQAFVDDQAARAEARNQQLAVALLLAIRASIALDRGLLDEAELHAAAAWRIGELIGDSRLVLVDVASVLIRVAMHRGDLPRIERWRREIRLIRPEAHRQPVIAELLLIAADTSATGDAVRVPDPVTPELLDADLANMSISRDLGDDVLRVRILMRLGWDASVRAHETNVRVRAEKSRSPLATAVSAHVIGLVHGDADLLREAAVRFHAIERPLLEASAREDLAAQPGTADDEAIQDLRMALDVWEKAGATRDLARVARRLRRLGVRVSSEAQPAAPGLSPAETRVLDELLKRQTTAQIAAVLSLSPNTVSVHLRRIYAKAGVSSRRELIELINRSS